VIYIYNISNATLTKTLNIGSSIYNAIAAVDKNGTVVNMLYNGYLYTYLLSNGSLVRSVFISGGYGVTSMACTQNGNIYYVNNNYLYVMNSTGAPLGSFALGTFFSTTPGGLAIHSNGSIYIGTTNAINVYNSTGAILQTFSVSNSLYVSPQIALSPLTGNIYTTLPQNLQIFSSSGTLLNTFTNSDKNLISPKYLAINHVNGNIAVVDSPYKKVIIFDKNGVFLFTLAGTYFSYINDVTFDDNNGNIVVADTFGIITFDSQGTYLQTIQVYFTFAIAIDKNSNIYAYRSGNITTYSSDGTLLNSFRLIPATGTVNSIKITNLGNIAISNIYYQNYTSYKLDIYNPNGNLFSEYYFLHGLNYFAIDGNSDFIVSTSGYGFSIYNYYGTYLTAVPNNILNNAYLNKFDLYQDNILACDASYGGIIVLNTNNTFATYSTYLSHSSLAHCEYISEPQPSSQHHISFGVKNNSLHSTLFFTLLAIVLYLLILY